MDSLSRYPILAALLKPFRRSQQKTCADLVAALCHSAQASSFALAGQLACLTDAQFGSALTRLYRFWRNERCDDWRLTEQLLQFRAAKGVRCGLKLKWTQFTKAEFIGRMYLLVGVALLLRTSVGRAVAETAPRVRLLSKQKGVRLSLARLGAYYWQQVTKQVKLTRSFVRAHLPPPRLRAFKWLTAPQKC